MDDRHPLAALLDLVLPTPCAGCGDPAARWCAACSGRFARPRVRHLHGLPPVLVLAPYAGPARATVLAYKERGRRDLARPLARRVHRALRAPSGVGLVLVPAPSRAAVARARGGDHMVRLARATARAAGPGARVVRAFALGRGARDSVGLDGVGRAANLARHLRAHPGALATLRADGGRSRTVLLDDVLTTGATASACVRLLAGAGVRVDAVVVLTAPARAGRGRRRAADPGPGPLDRIVTRRAPSARPGSSIP